VNNARRQGSPPPRGRVALRQLGVADFPPPDRLKLPAEFERVRAEGKTQVGRLMLLNIMPAANGHSRLGVVSSRRFHKRAVARNRARRMMREAWRLIQPSLTAPLWVVLVARPYMLGRGAGEVQQELLAQLTKAGYLAS
jgi:ribonuclease P protein component